MYEHIHEFFSVPYPDRFFWIEIELVDRISTLVRVKDIPCRAKLSQTCRNVSRIVTAVFKAPDDIGEHPFRHETRTLEALIQLDEDKKTGSVLEG